MDILPSAVDIKSTFDSKKANVRSLLSTLNGNRADLQNLIQEYRSQGLDIKILTSEGKIL
jgi:hypothetical protein